VPANLNAWSNYHLALQHMYRFTKQDNAAAAALFERALSQDHGFARASAGLSFTHFQDAFVKYSDAPEKAAANARRFAERSLELDPLDPFANFNMCRSFWLAGEMEGSIAWLDRAVSLSPNYAQGIYSRAFTEVLSGQAGTARGYVDNAVSLSPLDPLLYGMLGVRALSYVAEGDFEKAAFWAEKAARSPGAHHLISMIAMAAHTLDNNEQKALFWMADIYRREPNASQAHFFNSFPFSDPSVRERISGAFSLHGF
jgi:tetratricopeptide (TPR) repeat protein